MSLCSINDFEDHALKTLSLPVFDYYSGGACNEETLLNNRTSFSRLRIRPRVLLDVSARDTNTTVLGCKVKIPIGVAPTAMQKLAHPDGEIGNARAVGAVGGIFILSTMSTTSIEDVAEAAPDTIKWMQFYVYKDRNLTVELVKRAEKVGFKALVCTVDGKVTGIRYGLTKHAFEMPSHLGFANFKDYFANMPQDTKSNIPNLVQYVVQMRDDKMVWDDLKWLTTITKLPIIVKGILTGEDAVKAIKYGASAIFVSNHGGRQLDSTPSTIEALPEIIKAVDGRAEVYFDGGVRYGTDVFKAMALGAKMVFVGRPVLWGLAHSGEQGVKRVLDILVNEFKTTLTLTGCNKLADICKEMIAHESYYHNLYK